MNCGKRRTEVVFFVWVADLGRDEAVTRMLLNGYNV